MKKENQSTESSLAARIRQLRKKRDWSQGQVAKKVGIESQRISQYERGLTTPPIEVVDKIADVFEVSTDYLIRGKSFNSHKTHSEELLEKIAELEKLPIEYQKVLISVMDSFIMRSKFEELTQK